MTIPQLKSMFEIWKNVMVNNLREYDKKNISMKRLTTSANIKYWKKELKKANKILWIIEHMPDQIIIDISGNI